MKAKLHNEVKEPVTENTEDKKVKVIDGVVDINITKVGKKVGDCVTNALDNFFNKKKDK